MQIADAEESDIPAIVAIYNDVMRTSTAIWSDRPATLEERQQWLEGRRVAGFPVLVARHEGTAVGFASFGQFRTWPGYARTVELTIHIADGHRGGGIGSQLIEELVVRARDAGKHVMVAGVDADNTASIHFHEAHGFVRVAHMPEVGRKFDRWLDLILLQRRLD